MDPNCVSQGHTHCATQCDENACGNILNKTGYGCMTRAMLEAWRGAWSSEPGTTDALFPFGIVVLASEEVRVHIIRHARIENVGKSQSCMVSKLPIIWKQTVAG